MNEDVAQSLRDLRLGDGALYFHRDVDRAAAGRVDRQDFRVIHRLTA